MARTRSTSTDSTGTGSATGKKPRKARTSSKKAFLATIAGDDTPKIVIAFTQKDALDAIVSLRTAQYADLVQAGKEGYQQIDVTKNDSQQTEAPLGDDADKQAA